MASKIDNAVAAAINRMEPELLRAFLASFANVRSSFRHGKIVEALRAGRVADALLALQVKPEFFGPMDAALTQAFRDGGTAMVGGVPANAIQPGIVASPLFNMRNPKAEAWLRDRITVLAANISAEQADIARDIIVRGMATDRSRTAIALDIVGRINPTTKLREGGVIGLSKPQAQFVSSARDELASGDPKKLRNYLRRTLRDKRFDSMVKKAIISGKPLSNKQVNAIADKYSSRLLRARGEVIARHEAIAATNAGKHEGMRQIIDSGVINQNQIKRKWNTQGDARVRDTHSGMGGQVVTGKDEPFVSPSGARMMYPHDTSLGAGADEIANCRCRESTTVMKKSEVDANVLQPTDEFQTALSVQGVGQ